MYKILSLVAILLLSTDSVSAQSIAQRAAAITQRLNNAFGRLHNRVDAVILGQYDTADVLKNYTRKKYVDSLVAAVGGSGGGTATVDTTVLATVARLRNSSDSLRVYIDSKTADSSWGTHINTDGNVIATPYGKGWRLDLNTTFKLSDPTVIPVNDSALLLQGLAADLYAARTDYNALKTKSDHFESWVVRKLNGDNTPYVPAVSIMTIPGLAANYRFDTLVTIGGGMITAVGSAGGVAGPLAELYGGGGMYLAQSDTILNNQPYATVPGFRGLGGVVSLDTGNAGINAFSVFVVYRDNNTTTSTRTQRLVTFTGLNGAADTNGFSVYTTHNSTTATTDLYGDAIGANGTSRSSITTNRNKFHIASAIFNRSKTTAEVLVTEDGIAGSTNNVNNGGKFSTSANLIIGSERYSSIQQSLNGDIAQVVIYNRQLTPEEQGVVIFELETRFGL